MYAVTLLVISSDDLMGLPVDFEHDCPDHGSGDA